MANTKITTNVIADGSITTAKLADDAVTAAKIVAGAVIADVASNSITLAKMAANSIDSDQYVDGSIDTAHIAASQITNALMADDAIDSAEIADGAIDLAHMSANSIDSDQYVDGSIDTAHIAASQITNALMADDAIDSAEIADGAVDLAHMSVNSIDSDQYVDGSIDTAHIADDQVTAAKLANTINTDIATGVTANTTANAALPKAGGAMTGAITTNSTFDGVDIAARDAILTSTTTTANAAAPLANPTLTGTPAAPTASGSTSTTQLATTAFVQQELTTLIGGAPSTLNDLNELAAAINDDANYNSTLTTALATKLPLAGGTMTGAVSSNSSITITNGSARFIANSTSSGDYVRMYGSGGTGKWDIYGNGANLRISDNESAGLVAIDTALTVGGTLGVTGVTTLSAALNTTGNITIDSAASAGLTLDRASTSTGSTVDFKTAGTLKWYMGLRGLTNDNWYLRDEVGSTNALTVTSGGNLSVAGTLGVTGAATFSSTIASGYLNTQITHTSTDVTAANSNSTLRIGNTGAGNGVYNTIKFAANQQDMYIMAFNHQTQASRRLGFFLGSVAGDATTDERLSILGDGKVGIGTASPAEALDVAGNIRIGDGSGEALKMGTQRTLYRDGTALYFGEIDSSSTPIQMRAGGNDVMHLAVNGNVGIGTTSPSYQLDISGDSRVRVTGTNASNFGAYEAENNAGVGAFFGMGGNGRSDLLDNRGYVNTQTASDGLVISNEGADPIIFAVGGIATSDEKMRIHSDGKVGIGNTTPGSNFLTVGNTSGSSELGIIAGTSSAAYLYFGDGYTGSDRYRGYIGYYHNGDYMTLNTSTTPRLRVDGDGIKFNADTAAANALDDYEEGTWTPYLKGSTGSTGSYAKNFGTAHYTKIGNRVFFHCSGYIQNKGSYTGNTIMTGLPFTNVGSTTAIAMSLFPDSGYGTTSGNITISAQVLNGGTTVGFYEGSRHDVQHAYADVGTGYYVNISGSYQA